MKSLLKFLRNFCRQFVGIFFPSHCVSCNKIIGKHGIFCHECWPNLQFITEPKCAICSYPFEVEIKEMQPLCSSCLKKHPSYDKAIVLFRYNKIIGKVIGDLKYRDRGILSEKLAIMLLINAQKEIMACNLIAAVPLHISKLRKRKFNQAVLLAKSLVRSIVVVSENKALKPQFYPDLLFKVKPTEPQAKLKRKQREKNLKRAFLVNHKYRNLVAGKTVLLLDDVITTGATVENCAKELKRRGAKEVIVLALAKTIFK